MADENEWQFLGSDELTGDDDEVTVSGLTSHKLYQALFYLSTTTGENAIRWSFNDVKAGTTYAARYDTDGGGDVTNVSQANLKDNGAGIGGTAGENILQIYDIVNISGEEKLGIAHSIYNQNLGASNAPLRIEQTAKWVPSPLSTDITQIDVFDSGAGNDFRAPTNLQVAGVD